MDRDFDDFIRAYRELSPSEPFDREFRRRLDAIDDSDDGFELFKLFLDYIDESTEDKLRAYHEWITKGQLPTDLSMRRVD